MEDYPLILEIDLFCGAGGTTTGSVRARIDEYQPVKVIACVNHDEKAIESHKVNHPDTLHFNEDIRSQYVIDELQRLVKYYRSKYPNAYILLWASMECTNYSKAKGGEPKDPDSRSLPNEMFRYLDAINPDYFEFENVEEFMAWGPLDENGRPKSMKRGQEYLRWVQAIKDRGYRYEKRMLDAADYGAYTSRERLFGKFAKGDLPIVWPEATHTAEPRDNMFGKLEPWKPVRDCLDFHIEGKSMFTRKKPLVENTCKRILAGLEKYVPDFEEFLMKYYGNGANVESIDQPAGTLTKKDRFCLIQTAFIDKQYRSKYNHQSINEPAGTIVSNDKHCLVTAWIDKAYTGKTNHQGINEPAGTLLTKDKFSLVQAHFIDRQYSSGSHNHSSVKKPLGAITTVPKSNLVSVKVPWIMQYNYNNVGNTVNEPSPTLLASRHHHYVAQAVYGNNLSRLEPKEADNPTMKKIKAFCRKRGIIDIKTRMLQIPELKRIQGFGDDYYLAGTKTEQKKFIGNSVVPIVVKAMMEALAHELKDEVKQVA
ncbi:DNA (cytosine-5)-methyltransferase 1 [Fodinibius salinus]|uniref:DNA (cytosine-5-)-methyltransferase n=1 Tax=Fodinibius salinus TaxID=860790 RepID=A0A5D3YFZ3_9BACT|nr:DNA cytosine methyltransferase [Fodinibius salinus]TYP92061.1 DNA (cytosine-5)-methyltransferase 1 [Fodinibius salinus]